MKSTCVWLCHIAKFSIFTSNYDELDHFERSIKLWNPCTKENCYYLGLFQLSQYEFLCFKDTFDHWFNFNTSSTDSTFITANPLLFHGNQRALVPDLIGKIYLGFGGGFGSRTFDVYHQPYDTRWNVFVQILGHFR